jgi:hypothetical protein
MIRHKRIYHNLPLPYPRVGTAIATKVNTAAEIRPVLSVLKFKRPIARPPRTMVKFNHERKVRSLAKKTVV